MSVIWSQIRTRFRESEIRKYGAVAKLETPATVGLPKNPRPRKLRIYGALLDFIFFKNCLRT